MEKANDGRPSSVLDMFSLAGRSALVTGGHGELGEVIATTLAQLGCNVMLVARKEAMCASIAEKVRATYNVEAFSTRCDVTSEEEVSRAVDLTVDKLGSVDILVNSAGTAWAGAPENIPLSGWRKAFDVNVTGPFLTCRAVGPHMIRAGRGSIINIASTGGLMSFPPEMNDIIPYTTSKAAVIKFTRDLAVSWARHGIRVNALAPGQITSGLTLTITAEQAEAVRVRVPLKRLGQPSEMAGAIAFLASDASSYMTGHTLIVDGGQTLV